MARFNVSSQTIRKDINQLAERHLVRRTHGGIAPVSSTENLPFDHRQFLNSDAKQAIAAKVAQMIPSGASVFWALVQRWSTWQKPWFLTMICRCSRII